jgi:hypothetical protein
MDRTEIHYLVVVAAVAAVAVDNVGIVVAAFEVDNQVVVEQHVVDGAVAADTFVVVLQDTRIAVVAAAGNRLPAGNQAGEDIPCVAELQDNLEQVAGSHDKHYSVQQERTL